VLAFYGKIGFASDLDPETMFAPAPPMHLDVAP